MALTRRQLLFADVLAGVLTHPYARYVTVVVYQCPLQGLEIKLEDVIVYWERDSSAVGSESRREECPWMMLAFISILIKAPKSVNLIISAICHGRIDQASWSLTAGPCNLWLVVVTSTFGLLGRTCRHEVGVVGRGSRGWCSVGSVQLHGHVM